MIQLNDMELKYVQLACQGLSRRQIAAVMHRSDWTIVGYQESVREKTQSKTTVEAVAKLYDLGILKPKSSYETIRTRSLCPQAMEGDSGPG